MIRVGLLTTLMAAVPFSGWSQAVPTGQQQQPARIQPLQPEASQSSHATPSTPSTAGGTIAGVVRSGQTPLPGVTVTAKNTLTGKQYVTATDGRGAFVLHINEDGRYVVRTEFAAFASTTKEVLLHGGNAAPQTDFSMILESRQQQMEQAQARREASQSRAQGTRQYMAGQGAQNLGLLSGALGGALGAIAAGGESGGAALPSAANNSDFSTESVTVNGQSGTANPFAGVNMQEMRENLENMQQERTLAQIPGQRQGNFEGFGGGGPVMRVGPGPGGGGPGGGGPPPGAVVFGGRGGGHGGFNFRKFDPTKPHGALFWQGGNSLFDAKDFALRGQSEPQPPYNSNHFGAILAGSPYIPHVLENDTKDFIFLSLIGNHSSSPFDNYGTVPDAEERGGNFSGQQTIYDPATGLPFPGNVIPAGRISPQATALLKYVPLPNIPTTNRQNYQRLTTATTNTTTVGARYMRSFGGGNAFSNMLRQFGGASAPGVHQSINANFNYSHTGEDQLNLFPYLSGKEQMHQYSLQLGYSISVKRLTNNITANLNRSNTEVGNLFTNKQDIATLLGINVLSGQAVNPLNYGLPNVTMVQFTGLSEQQPNFQLNQTLGVSDSSSWLHGKHNVKFGGDYKRVDLNMIGQANSTGSFIFTGLATQQPGSNDANSAGTNGGLPRSGSSLADFLLGFPQQTAIQAPYQKAYLRANIYDAFLQDDWRVRANFTILAGLRYEYFSPYSEKDGRLATIDPSADFSQVAPVLAGGVGPYRGKYPKTLIYPDRDAFSPRVGFAWRAFRNTVVRGGYGMNFANGLYISFIQNLAFQPPFADVQTNQATQPSAGVPACTAYWSLCLANGFGTPQAAGNYSVNKNYRLPYVQVWNLDIQRTLPAGIVLNVGWNGAKGTRLDVLTAPGRNANSSLSGVYYNYSDSIGFSNYNAGTVRLRKRLQGGIAIGATYTYSHAIDDASAIGGNGGTTAVVAQNWRNILAEESNSSFDIRHNFKGDFLYELPFGPDAHFLTGGDWLSHAIANVSFSGTFAFATGEPLTPRFVANSADVARGSVGSLRPNRVPGVSLTAGGGKLDRWFNTNAFSSVFAPGQVYGTASRYSIPGPGTLTFDASLSKTIRLGEMRNLEFRGTADNVLNTVQYAGVDTNLGSSTYGQVTSAAQMRTFVLMGRFRF